MRGALVLADGTVFEGDYFGAAEERTGEVVFNTSMGGYGEIISDPASSGKIIVMTYPLIGNYGINREELQSERVQASGLIFKEGTTQPSSWLLQDTLENLLKENGVPALTGIDSRAVTRYIREKGSMPGMITSAESVDPDWFNKGGYSPSEYIKQVSTKNPYSLGEGKYHLVVLDLGVKKDQLRALMKHNCRLTVMPAGTNWKEIMDREPDGLVLSSGPEGGQEVHELAQNLNKAINELPTMGIGLGMEVMALALGAELQKLKFGHRGSNYPVKDLERGKTVITYQNHGYVVKESSLEKTGLFVSEENIHDGTVEGLKHRELPLVAVQYYPFPEAHLEGEETFYSKFISLL
ncbi:MAG: carbamoyl phosphate synthase small subunit [Candidatus Syntrophonatronum acetioxidans]|uniref:Carbamoyl phosphate synthase small chain n=2 Tax=Candidatus Syntrophonatronum acetioxidans TaxID=1795816 RepID=A0A424YIF4_9FIRM|nr:MAG: carbamoyl phosphate synthase small subunit [Candidatus Syntrophonatronum acetioxidans]